MAAVTLEELRTERGDLKAQIAEIDAEFSGERFPADVKTRWNTLNSEIDECDERIRELETRQERVRELSGSESNRENVADSFNTRRAGAVTGESVYDISTVRRDFNDPTVEGRELRDRALKAVEMTRFAHPDAEQADARTHVAALVGADSFDGRISRYLLATGAPAYKRAFGKLLAPGGAAALTREEQAAVLNAQMAERAMSLTGSAGGYAVPFELDPTIIPTSNSSVNPWRAVARVVNVTVDEWRGISAGAITAAYAAEATESSDNAPTLAQPIISTEKAQAFIPFSIEVGMDWNGLQAEMAKLLQDSKDDLEATKFAVGSGTNEPQGVITGATTVVTATGTGAFAIADLDTLEAALPPRFQSRASIVMNRFVAQKIRHFDTSGAAGVWNQSLQLAGGLPINRQGGSYETRVLGYPAYEASAMAATLTTGSAIAILGDFNYYVIVDRIGLSVEVIPHLVGTNHRPTGQRGLYAYWRNSAGVISPSAFRVLHTG